jgi:branched-chain amino acid transport system ATP-binding protein
MAELLTLEGISLTFGGVNALSSVSAGVEEGRITAVIGPNGAGKTSLFNVISGFYRASGGRATYAGADLLRKPGHARAKLGIARTFQNIALFSGLSVLENIKLGAHAGLSANVGSGALYLGPASREEAALTERIDREILPALGLETLRDRPISGLPYGEQKRIELARAMVMSPRLIMLDEPFAGMPPAEKRRMGDAIRRFVTDGRCTALLIDHDMETVMGLCDHIVVLNFGRVIAAGPPDAVRAHPDVVDAYLGTG